ncbi:MAG: DUF2232 domain-containing protein [Thermoanaerobaculia bacterium]
MTETSLQHEPVPLPGRSAGRMVRGVAGYAMLLALMFISPLFVFIPAALFHCGIRNGKRIVWSALVLGVTLAGLLAMQSSHAPAATSADSLMGYSYLIALVLGIAVPAMIVMPLVARGEAFGRVLMIAVVLSMAGLGITEATMRASAGFSPFAEQVLKAKQTSAQFVAVYEKAGMPSDAIQVLKKWTDVGASCLPAFFLIDVIIVFVLSLVMFGRLRAWRQFVTTREPAPPAGIYLFRNLSLPEWLLFAFVIGGLTPLASGLLQKVTANVLAVVTFLYLLQGLAIFRSLLAAVGAGFAGVMFGYLLLAFLTITGIAPLLLSVAGLFDSFFDFRHFKRKDHPDESHPD